MAHSGRIRRAEGNALVAELMQIKRQLPAMFVSEAAVLLSARSRPYPSFS
jgi:hypothetical protein